MISLKGAAADMARYMGPTSSVSDHFTKVNESFLEQLHHLMY